MQEVFRTNEPAQIAFIKSLFDSAKIKYFVFGEYLTSALGGMLDNLSECRFMVLEQDYKVALTLLEDAGLFDGEVEVFVTKKESDVETLKKTLTSEEIEYYVEEDVEYKGLIPKAGDKTTTYRFIVPEAHCDAACDIIDEMGLSGEDYDE